MERGGGKQGDSTRTALYLCSYLLFTLNGDVLVNEKDPIVKGGT